MRETLAHLQHDVHEKIEQLSQIRLVAEAMGRGLHRSDYYKALCRRMAEIFHAPLAYLLWQREGADAEWWVRAWHEEAQHSRPRYTIVPMRRDELLDSAWRHGRPLWQAGVDGDSLLEIWEEWDGSPSQLLLLPLRPRLIRQGMLVLVEPSLEMEPANRHRHLAILGDLVNQGMRNRALYERVEQSEREFRDLFENGSDMILLVREDGLILEANHAFRAALGLKETPQGRTLQDYVAPRQDGGGASALLERISRGEQVRNEDLELLREDGRRAEVELSGSLRTATVGGKRVARLYIRDVTDKRAGQRQRAALEREVELERHRKLAQVGLHVSGIVHNLQNPLQALYSQVALLKMRSKVDQELLEPIETSTQQLLDIVNTLLAKMSKEASTEVVEVDLNKVIETELDFLSSNSFFKHEVSRELELDPALPLVRGIYSDFSQVIMNLVYNAIDAMQETEEKRLHIVTESKQEGVLVEIRISDTGSGIPPEVRERIFQPFFTTKRKGVGAAELASGSGLGLSSALSMLEPYGGTIDFTTKVGVGTTFRVRIPTEGLQQ